MYSQRMYSQRLCSHRIVVAQVAVESIVRERFSTFRFQRLKASAGSTTKSLGQLAPPHRMYTQLLALDLSGGAQVEVEKQCLKAFESISLYISFKRLKQVQGQLCKAGVSLQRPQQVQAFESKLRVNCANPGSTYAAPPRSSSSFESSSSINFIFIVIVCARLCFVRLYVRALLVFCLVSLSLL